MRDGDVTDKVDTLDAGYAALSKFQVHRPVIVTKAMILVGTQDGNLDIGIYDEDLTLLGSVGGSACLTPGEAQYTLSAPVNLLPGVLYYSAFVTASGSATFAARSFPYYYAGMGGYYATSYPLGTLGAPFGAGASKVVLVVFS